MSRPRRERVNLLLARGHQRKVNNKTVSHRADRLVFRRLVPPLSAGSPPAEAGIADGVDLAKGLRVGEQLHTPYRHILAAHQAV